LTASRQRAPRSRGCRTLCIQGAARSGGDAHPEVSLHAPSLADHVACLDRGDWRSVAGRMLGSATKP
jgi:aspartate racemase